MKLLCLLFLCSLYTTPNYALMGFGTPPLSSPSSPSNRIVEGDLFIVPNKASKAYEYCKGCDYFGNWSVLAQDGNPFKVDKRDFCVHVWAVSKNEDVSKDAIKDQKLREGSDDWASHNHPALGRFPHHLPYALLKDRKEGDIVEFDYQNEETKEVFIIRLTCRQVEYRYRDWGNFEDCLKKVIAEGIYWGAINTDTTSVYYRAEGQYNKAKADFYKAEQSGSEADRDNAQKALDQARTIRDKAKILYDLEYEVAQKRKEAFLDKNDIPAS